MNSDTCFHYHDFVRIMSTLFNKCRNTIMHAFLIIGANHDTRKEYIEKRLAELSIHPADQIIIYQEGSIGIAEIRALQKSLTLKPIAGRIKSAIIWDAAQLTIAAQHALLKTLEEPPANTTLFVASPTEEILLPTIISRCKIVRLQKKQESIGETEKKQFYAFWKQMFESSPVERLFVLPEFGKSRGEYLEFLQSQLNFLHEWLIESVNNNSKEKDNVSPILINSIIKKALTTYNLINSNCNPRLCLDNLFLHL